MCPPTLDRSIAYLFHAPGQVSGLDTSLGSIRIAQVEVVVAARSLLIVQKVDGHAAHLVDLAAVVGEHQSGAEGLVAARGRRRLSRAACGRAQGRRACGRARHIQGPLDVVT